jgi:hypothetical protein
VTATAGQELAGEAASASSKPSKAPMTIVGKKRKLAEITA